MVRCVECGYDNSPEYRFCGMCGVMLRPSAGPEPPKETAGGTTKAAAQEGASGGKSKTSKDETDRTNDRRGNDRRSEEAPLSGPSFLGLADQEKPSSDYLLEEEPAPGHGRMYAALILLIIAGGLMYWHWRQNGYPWLAKTAATTATTAGNAPANPQPDANAPASEEATTPQTASAGTNEPVTEETQPSETSANHDATASEEIPAASSNPEAATPSPPGTELTPGQAAEQYSDSEASSGSHSEDTSQIAPAKPKSEATVAKTPSAIVPIAKPTPAHPKQVHAEAHIKPTTVASLERPKPAAPAAAPEDEGAALAMQGERYLYGNGVPQNCDLAQKSLLAAASRANVHSQVLLGTMYATGHCAVRNLSSAYNWYAKALHQDPSNKRISDDLEAVWREMTPAERQQTIQ
jgi:hypothetical protein